MKFLLRRLGVLIATAVATSALALVPASAWATSNSWDFDSSFGVGGVTSAVVPGGTYQGNAITVAADGKIFVGGAANSGDLAVSRYTVTGALDSSYGVQGIAGLAEFSVAGLGYSIQDISGMIRQADGKIVVAANIYAPVVNGNQSDILLVRFDVNGDLDASFNGGTGYRIFGVSAEGENVGSLVQDSAGSLYSLGFTTRNVAQGDYESLIVKFTPGGLLDTTWAPSGARQYRFSPFNEYLTAGYFDSSGRLVVVGVIDVDGVIARISPSGTLDSSFAATGPTPGYLTLPSLSQSMVLTDVSLDSQQRILVSGYDSAGSGFMGLVARFTSTGSLDGSFNPSGAHPGVVYLSVSSTATRGEELEIRPDGKILLSGTYVYAFGLYGVFLAEFDGNGVLNIGFNLNGSLPGVVTFSGQPSHTYTLGAMKLLPSGTVLATGMDTNQTNYYGQIVWKFGPGTTVPPAVDAQLAQTGTAAGAMSVVALAVFALGLVLTLFRRQGARR